MIAILFQTGFKLTLQAVFEPQRTLMLTDFKADSMPTMHAPIRLLLLAIGWLCFTLGLVGIFLPLLPTTIFWIIAVWCWLKSAPALAGRIYGHPKLGAPVQSFIEHGQMTRAAKLTAATGMLTGFLLWRLFSSPNIGWQLGVGLGMVLVALWLACRPEPG